MAALFPLYSTVSDTDKKFTAMLDELKEALKDNFAWFDTYYGYKTTELHEFISELPGDLFEDDNDEDELHCIHFAKKSSVTYLMAWLANWDMVYMDRDAHCSESRSNHQDVAKLLNKMYKIAE